MKRPTPWIRALIVDSRGQVVAPDGELPGGAALGGQSFEGAAAHYSGVEGPWALAGLYSRPEHQVRGGEHRMEVWVALRLEREHSEGVPIESLSEPFRGRVVRWMAGELPVE